MKSAPSFTVRIWIAGDIDDARRTVREFCQKGSCWTVSPCDYIYTDGQEAGICATRINYPRFPSPAAEILKEAQDLAELLAERLFQNSYSVETPAQTFWASKDNPAT